MFSKKDQTYVTKKTHPKLFKELEKILIKSKTKTPKIELIESKDFDAQAFPFPFYYYLYITTGLWNELNLEERLAVILHEIGHLNDKFAKFTSIISVLFFILLLIFFSSLNHIFISSLILTILFFRFTPYSYLSRRVEYNADKFVINWYNKKYLKKAVKKYKTPPRYKQWISRILFFPFPWFLFSEERGEKLYPYYIACLKWIDYLFNK